MLGHVNDGDIWVSKVTHRWRRRADHEADLLGVPVLDAGQRKSVVSVRSLGRAGLRIGVFECQAGAPALRWRYSALCGLPPPLGRDTNPFVDALLDRIHQSSARLIICAHDRTIEALRSCRREVKQNVTLTLMQRSNFGGNSAGDRVLMEINPGLSASVEQAVRSGDQVPESTDYREGLRMRWLGGDIRDFARRCWHDYASLNDPMPSLAAVAGFVRKLPARRSSQQLHVQERVAA